MSRSLGTRPSAFGAASAFTFVEVLFAIIILGIGMIMIAGVLPVAIKQNSDTRDELTGQALAQAGLAHITAAVSQYQGAFLPTVVNPALDTPLAAVPDLDLYSAPTPDADPYAALNAGRVVPLTYGNMAQGDFFYLAASPAFQGSRISSTDPRYQWLAFYRRDTNARSIQFTVLAMRLHNTDPVSRYSVGNDNVAGTMYQREFPNRGNGPFRVNCRVIDGSVNAAGDVKDLDDPTRFDADRIVFTGTNADQDDFDRKVAGTGAFVIVNHAPSTADDSQRPFRNNGRIFRLGQRRADLDAAENGRVWELQSGYDLVPADAGTDLILGTADDLPDGSLSYEEVDPDQFNTRYEVSAWMVGRGRTNPTAEADELDSFGGLPQDVLVLQANIPVR